MAADENALVVDAAVVTVRASLSGIVRDAVPLESADPDGQCSPEDRSRLGTPYAARYSRPRYFGWTWLPRRQLSIGLTCTSL